MKLIAKANRIFERVIEGMAGIAGISIVFTMLLVSVDVGLRYFLNSPIPWSTVASESILLYATFLGAVWILKNEGHVKVDILINQFNPRTQAMLGIITSVIGIIIALILFVYGIQATWVDYVSKLTTGGTTAIPKFILMAIIPICSFPLLIQFLKRGHRYLESFRASPRE